MVSLDYTVFIQIVNFLILILILNSLLYKPILQIIDRRKQQLDESAEEIKHLQLTVEQKMSAYEDALREAKLKALDEKNEIMKEGSEQAKIIIETARAGIPQILEEFNEKLVREVSEARNILNSQSQKISLEIAEKVLGRSLQ